MMRVSPRVVVSLVGRVARWEVPVLLLCFWVVPGCGAGYVVSQLEEADPYDGCGPWILRESFKDSEKNVFAKGLAREGELEVKAIEDAEEDAKGKLSDRCRLTIRQELKRTIEEVRDQGRTVKLRERTEKRLEALSGIIDFRGYKHQLKCIQAEKAAAVKGLYNATVLVSVPLEEWDRVCSLPL